MNEDKTHSFSHEDIIKHEVILIEFLSVVMNKEFEELDQIFNPKIVSEMIFMIDQEMFSKLLVEEHSLEEVLVELNSFLTSKGIPLEIEVDSLLEGHKSIRVNFLIDLIVMVKIFNPEQFKYYESLFEEDFKLFFNEMILFSEDQLKGRLDGGNKSKHLHGFSHQEMQKEMEEKRLLRKELQNKEDERDELALKNQDQIDEIKAIRNELKNQIERYALLEEAVDEKNKEYLEEFDRREETHEQMIRYQLELKGYKEACARYAVEEERFETMIMEKDKKIKKYLNEIEEHEKTINIYELQMKEFSKITQQYKNEKVEFMRRKEIVSILKKKNHDKNQMVYYFNHKNFQLSVEKEKLDQYIKLCQYQIQKLTSENKNLKHENEVFKTLNQNLMELGGTSQGGKVGGIGVSPEGKYSFKFVGILKENIQVSF